MAISGFPWFKVYAAETLSDENFMNWSPAERGAWFTLLCHCWKEGSIPADIERMGRLCSCNADAMQGLWVGIADRFRLDSTGTRYTSPRLEFERQSSLEEVQSKSDHGKRAAKARWDQVKKEMHEQSPGNAGAMPNDAPQSQPQSQPQPKEVPPIAPQGAPVSPEELKLPKPERAAKKGRNFKLPELEMSPEEESAFERVWSAWPRSGWNFATKSASPRRIHRSEAALRFQEIIRYFPYTKGDGGRLTANDLAEATLAFVDQRVKAAQGGPPTIPCIDNFYSSVEGQKNPWKDALQSYFAAGVAS